MADDLITARLDAIRDRGYRNGATGARCGRLSDAAAIDVPRLLAAVEGARKVHTAVPIYEIALHGHASSPVDGGFILHCGHPDTALDDDRHAESDEGDWICLDQLVHTACGGCRDDEGELADFANCATRAAITAALLGQDAPSVTGEDSSDD